jgi:hypothetical protein
VKAFAREEALFVAAVLVGSVTGLIVEQLLLHWVSRAAAGNVALALATTMTGATHARLVHRHSIGALVPSVAVGAPLAYVVMRMIHVLLGS